MSKIIAVNNFNTKNWNIEVINLDPYCCELFIGFTHSSPVIFFKNLKFGFKLVTDNNILTESSYPSPNTRYVRTDQICLINKMLYLQPDQTYMLHLWCENNEEYFEKEFEFVSPRTIQSYTSWMWDEIDKMWVAPIPKPNNGKYYQWNEESQIWEEFDLEEDD
jgi:hypothetical protein